jgi:hypothetical protein
MVDTSPLTLAYQNHGRWLIDCPHCNTGWIVRAETPSLLIDAKGRVQHACFCGYIAVAQFPAERVEIDELLARRPDPSNRNWRPGETIADLRIENAAYLTGGA